MEQHVVSEMSLRNSYNMIPIRAVWDILNVSPRANVQISHTHILQPGYERV